jgi:biopolymer transport protein ExbD
MKRILCALCISLVGWQAMAGEVDESLKKLDAALQKAPKEQGQNVNEMYRNGMFPSLRRDIVDEQFNLAKGNYLQPGQIMDLSEEAKKAAEDLRAALGKEEQNRQKAAWEAQQARDKAAAAPIEAAFKYASASVNNAKTAADLDAVIAERDAFKFSDQKRNGLSEELKSKYDQLQGAYEFVASWQEYLAAKAAGYDDKAREIARTLADASTRLIPRSELLAKAYEPKTADDKNVSKAVILSQVVINLEQDGRASIDKGGPVPLGEMKEALERIKANNPSLAVLLRAKNVPYQKIKDTLEVIGSVGITNVTISNGAPASSSTSPFPSAPDATSVPQPTPAK